MKIMPFDFRCNDESCNTKFEEWVNSKQKESHCPECGGTARRLLSSFTIDPRLGLDPEGFPTMGDAWAKKHRDKAKQEKAKSLAEG